MRSTETVGGEDEAKGEREREKAKVGICCRFGDRQREDSPAHLGGLLSGVSCLGDASGSALFRHLSDAQFPPLK